MSRWLLAALACTAAQAASIGGVVLDNATTRPLARAQVVLRPVAGTGGKPLSMRANHAGQFHFSVTAGMYLVTASRVGFAPIHYGQKDWKAAGKPVAVEQDGSLFLDIRLHRYGAISGTVLDENEIGIPEQRVVVYHAKTPLAVVAGVITDERGIYRFHGLEPGAYYVRTVAKDLEDGSGLLPTLHPETTILDQAIAVEVGLDQEPNDVNIHPQAGKLFRVSGEVSGTTQQSAHARLTLISDTGRVKTEADDLGKFSFTEVAPGRYELLAENPAHHLAGFRELLVDKETDSAYISLSHLSTAEFHIEDEKDNSIDTASVKLMARRKDLDGPGAVEVLKLVKDRASLLPGHWEMSIVPPPAYYATAFRGPVPRDSERGRADGWNEIELRDLSPIYIKLSSHPAAVHGVVTASGQDPVPGAPVYLEAFDQAAHQRLSELRSTRTDLHGQYHFNALAPGVYRILSSFEFAQPDSETMEAAGARTLSLEESKDTAQDLELYVR